MKRDTANKYGAKPTVVDNIRFHSQKEARRYQELKLLEKAGEIHDLELQPRFPLSVLGVKLGTYVGDFRFVERRDLVRRADRAAEFLVVEDVKGMDTPLSKWKRKHVLAQYGIEVRLT